MPNTNFDSQFSEAEKALFQDFADNPHLYAAIKKLLLAGLYEQGTIKAGIDPNPTRNFALSLVFNSDRRSNEEIGQDLRALGEGMRIIETAFDHILDFKTQDKKVAKPNPAR